ncbi:hypothetical protein [Cupriavidus taiwanensis]|uniref:Uncharacterized protein n=1 Tax=Cupriavidus taiwanensis TaxID=164546 RepID=A0A7Z7JHH2_9BURK|nr:hypothetical protein [Cupriavidus taiwanensis]SOZ17002.1 conserved hypothetical protein [Cupriavidus taiwanensis]SOZ95926.1 conserved hypothetical protein [Cupriavidus taiwanensis]SPC25407.1 conserved hypothetical protein [Cupriavidus taiwanensis]SPD37652.1 conserved protein of unknown function [Cupriavidus taiwanensis]
MTPHAFFPTDAARGVPLVEKLVHDIDEQLEHTIDAGERARVMAIVRQCLTASLASPAPAGADLGGHLAASYLKPSEVIDRGLVAMSQATLYRAVEDARFYCVTPRGKAIGKAFPAWQFAPPVPEMLPAVLQQMRSLPSSEIHAFWVTPVDAFDDLTPAELLAGKPFETRATLTASQSSHLARPANERQARVIAQLAGLPSRSSDLIS